jgi:hypothetical protein
MTYNKLFHLPQYTGESIVMTLVMGLHIEFIELYFFNPCHLKYMTTSPYGQVCRWAFQEKNPFSPLESLGRSRLRVYLFDYTREKKYLTILVNYHIYPYHPNQISPMLATLHPGFYFPKTPPTHLSISTD